MNTTSIIGRLGKEPELRYTGTGKAVTNFSIAVYRDKENTDWFDCVAFEKTADLVTKFARKGNHLGVTGRMQKRSYKDKDGREVYVWELIAREVTFVDPMVAKEPAQKPSYDEYPPQNSDDISMEKIDQNPGDPYPWEV